MDETIKARGQVVTTAGLVDALAANIGMEAHRVAEVLRDAARRAGGGDYLQEVWAFIYQRDVCSGKDARVVIVPD